MTSPTISNTALFVLSVALDTLPTEQLMKKISSLTACQELWKRVCETCSEFIKERNVFLAEKVGIEARVRASMPGETPEATVVEAINKELVPTVARINEIGEKRFVFEAMANDTDFLNEFWDLLIPKLSKVGREDLIAIIQTFKIKDRA